ncbi:hypothetical protein QRD40_10880 [Comamonas sp. Y6]|uniref:Uncharacterized protein n=1 Tax=Comamonas resistens TaxID=3046670 RepID=A0ABY8SXM2_9BURK|nr:hypothetical protein [Comamonas resistens]MDL5036850.1 hypothetical protein [Comamonas resistens]WHS67160.1 hypothetical protein QMY55_08595 [Comamonas resistens]
MDINSIILSDAALSIIDNGTWVRNIDGMPGLGLNVCGLGSPEVQKLLNAKQTEMRTKNGGKPLSAEQLAKSLNETLAEVVLKDWEGLEDNGKPVAYAKATAKKWLTTRNGERFASIVLRAAQMVDADANSFVEKAGKNSLTA